MPTRVHTWGPPKPSTSASAGLPMGPPPLGLVRTLAVGDDMPVVTPTCSQVRGDRDRLSGSLFDAPRRGPGDDRTPGDQAHPGRRLPTRPPSHPDDQLR